MAYLYMGTCLSWVCSISLAKELTEEVRGRCCMYLVPFFNAVYLHSLLARTPLLWMDAVVHESFLAALLEQLGEYSMLPEPSDCRSPPPQG